LLDMIRRPMRFLFWTNGQVNGGGQPSESIPLTLSLADLSLAMHVGTPSSRGSSLLHGSLGMNFFYPARFLALWLGLTSAHTALAAAECPSKWPEASSHSAKLSEAQIWNDLDWISDSPPPSVSHQGKIEIEHWPLDGAKGNLRLRCIYSDGRQLTIILPAGVRECRLASHKVRDTPLEFAIDFAACDTLGDATPRDVIRHSPIDGRVTFSGLGLRQAVEQIVDVSKRQGMALLERNDTRMDFVRGNDRWTVLLNAAGYSVEVIQHIAQADKEMSVTFGTLLHRFGSPSRLVEIDPVHNPSKTDAVIWDWGHTGVRLEFIPNDGTERRYAFDAGELHLIDSKERP